MQTLYMVNALKSQRTSGEGNLCILGQGMPPRGRIAEVFPQLQALPLKSTRNFA